MAEQLAANPEIVSDSPEYIAEMSAKGEAAVNGGVKPPAPVEIASKPEGIPDKFYNPATGEVDYASLTKSYNELEKARSSKPEVKPVDKPEVKPEDTTETDAANKAVVDAGLDMNSLSQQYAEDGELTQDSYDKLAKAGIPKEMVDGYIAGQVARTELVKAQAYALTDGAEGYQAMVDWVRTNASPAEITAYNHAVNSGVSDIREVAIRDMWAKYGNDTGNTGNLITNKTTGKVNTGLYNSRAEMMADMANPKYKDDPAFRKTVETKLANSNIF